MCCPSVVLFLCFLCWLEDQYSGFKNRAIKHYLKNRKLILGYIRSTKMHRTIGTPPYTLRQPWVSVSDSCDSCDSSKSSDSSESSDQITFFTKKNFFCLPFFSQQKTCFCQKTFCHIKQKHCENRKALP